MGKKKRNLCWASPLPQEGFRPGLVLLIHVFVVWGTILVG